MEKLKKKEAFCRAVAAFGEWRTWSRADHIAYGLVRGNGEMLERYSASLQHHVRADEARSLARVQRYSSKYARGRSACRLGQETSTWTSYPLFQARRGTVGGMKLTVVTRADLRPGQQACQAMHAQRAFQDAHPEVEKVWFEQSNTLVLLVVPDESTLCRLLIEAEGRGIRSAIFREPDLQGQLTAIALEPGARAKSCAEDFPQH